MWHLWPSEASELALADGVAHRRDHAFVVVESHLWSEVFYEKSRGDFVQHGKDEDELQLRAVMEFNYEPAKGSLNVDKLRADRARFRWLRANFAGLESGRIPKALSMSEDAGIDSL